MRARELHDKTVEELEQMERELKRKLFNLRFQRATGELGNTAELGKTRRDVARVTTIVREKRALEARS